MTTIREIYLKTLSKMDLEFSTRTFNAKAIKFGLPVHKTFGDTRTFLLKECENLPNQHRMWRKTGDQFHQFTEFSVFKNEKFENEKDIEVAIFLLKSKGYKIMKPKEIQYEEI
jgi:hypothetical protein